MDASPDLPRQSRVPVFNMPGVVSAAIGILVAIHALREFVLPDTWDLAVLLDLALIPGRWTVAMDPSQAEALVAAASARVSDASTLDAYVSFARYIAADPAAMPWTFATYALLHGSWMHLVFNSVWLAAFGSPVARRCGTLRFCLLALAGAVAGAVLHLLLDPMSLAPLIGASASVSALMAAAARFVFQPPPLISPAAPPWQIPVPPPLQTIPELLRNRTAVVFLVIWLATNLLFGVIALPLGADGSSIAWDAHLGGFVIGFFLLPLIDRRRRPIR
ncbi:rhomboid family intramembrane serine protease [Methylobacterium sp. Leaf108]|uniref:rhomboid family intramembrane serine protease n=1 Tax=Methylobacterium sp. Leaf108 TaxID=1736256 RepID=UPI0006FC9567|nr:rhomboid family intramembrane serine protease [Methylobacterium sp. Leaf108]KQP50771.1 peptidase S54 [Methylobacterium sp. Leaf108]